MATNQVYDDADSLSLPVPSGTLANDPVVVGAALVGVAMTDRDDDGESTVRMKGAFTLDVAATAAMAVGDIVYITAATGVLSNTAAGNVRFGYLLQAIAGAGTASVRVKVGY